MIQILINTLSSAAIIAPAAVGFTLIFMLFRYVNFAAGAFVMAGAFAGWTANVLFGLPLWFSCILATIACAVLLAISDWLVFRPLRGRAGGTLLLVSIALSFLIENIARFFYGTQIKAFDIPLTRPYQFADARITHEAIMNIGVATVAILSVGFLLAFTPIGRGLRAIADNVALSHVRGLPVARLELVGIVIAGGLFGLSGTLVGVDLAIEPNLNWALAIPVIAAAILGGLGSPLGAALGALIIGLAEELTVIFISPPYKAAVGFVVIALVLLVRPEGLFGKPLERK